MFLLHRGEFEYRVQWIPVQFTLIIVNPCVVRIGFSALCGIHERQYILVVTCIGSDVFRIACINSSALCAVSLILITLYIMPYKFFFISDTIEVGNRVVF